MAAVVEAYSRRRQAKVFYVLAERLPRASKSGFCAASSVEVDGLFFNPFVKPKAITFRASSYCGLHEG